MTETLTIEQVQFWLNDCEKSGLDFPVQVCRQLLAAMQREEHLRRALWYISVNSMPPGDDWCEVPNPVARYAGDAIKEIPNE